MVNFNLDEIDKALVTLTIEKALLGIGEKAYEEVGKRLYKKYRCYFMDCLEHPEYLSEILKEIFGNSSTLIVESIKITLHESKDKKTISNFLTQISG